MFSSKPTIGLLFQCESKDIMYTNPVAVNRHDHNRLRFTPADNYGFSRGLSHIGVQAFELEQLSEYYPIVFNSHSGAPLAVLGIFGGCNLWLNEQDQWCAPVIPVQLSCYPFGLKKMEDGQYIIIMDTDAETLQAKKGKLLYNRRGESFTPSPLLKAMTAQLEAIEQQRLVTTTAFSALVEHQVLSPGRVDFTLDGNPHRLDGFSVLDWDKVEALGEAVKSGWQKNGLWQLLKAQTASLENFKRLQQMQAGLLK